MIMRYNMYSATAITGNTAPALAPARPSHDAGARRQGDARSMAYDWTELTYLQLQAGNTAMYVFVLGVMFVFLVLAAQYESWSLPLAVILVVPMCLLFSIVGVVPGGHRSQHLHADRLRGSGGPGEQERHPHRRVRQAGAGSRASPRRGGDVKRQPLAPAAQFL